MKSKLTIKHCIIFLIIITFILIVSFVLNPNEKNYFSSSSYDSESVYKSEKALFYINEDGNLTPYDTKQLMATHNFPLMIAIFIILVLLTICAYLIHITRPINSIVHRIILLSKGKFSFEPVGKGIYSEVRHSLNLLSNRLESNELERKKLDTMKKDWISNISHDIKTPLTSIRGNAEIMAVKGHNINEKTRINYSNIIISKCDYIKTLVEDLNLSTRLKDNNIILNKKLVNLVSILRHVIIDIINDKKYENGNITFNCSHEDIFVKVDEILIRRVFINLIINSFIHNNYKVNVNVFIEKVTSTEAKIIINDNGKGISEEELKHIFQRYYRGTNTSREVEGSGLGLAIAHDIVKAHDGHIEAFSTLKNGMKIEILLH